MAYYKVRIEVWCDWNRVEGDLDDIAQSMGVGEALRTKFSRPGAEAALGNAASFLRRSLLG
jgi:hypothetical protein